MNDGRMSEAWGSREGLQGSTQAYRRVVAVDPAALGLNFSLGPCVMFPGGVSLDMGSSKQRQCLDEPMSSETPPVNHHVCP